MCFNDFKCLMFLNYFVVSFFLIENIHSTTFTYTTNSGLSYNTTGVSNIDTSGADQVGIEVTAFFVGGGSETVSWNPTGTLYGGSAIGTGWSLAFDNESTFESQWQLENTSAATFIESLVINGAPGKIVFDILAQDPATPGSGPGGHSPFLDTGALPAVDGPGFVFSNPINLDLTFTYSNQVELNNIFYGDLYTTLTIDTNATPLGPSETLWFVSDTDQINPGDILVPAPEPAAYLLMVSMVSIVALIKRKKSLKS